MTNEVSGEERNKKLLAVIERIIGEEVDTISPRPESRNTLVLMALGRIHPVADQVYDEADVRYLVFDEKGQARTKNEDGRDVALTISDVVAELKQRYPKLFEQAAASAALPVPNVQERDWLKVATATDPAPDQNTDHPSLPAERMSDGRIVSAGDKPDQQKPLEHPAGGLQTTPSGSRSSRSWMLSALACLIGAVAFVTLLTLLFGDAGILSEKSDVSGTGNTKAATSGQGSPSSDSQQQVVSGVPEVIDTTTLKIGDEVIHLYGVEWARGGNADQLRLYLGDRETTCKRLAAQGVFRCEVDGRDLSTVVLFNGGARTAPDATPDLLAAEDHAKSEGKGVWKK